MPSWNEELPLNVQIQQATERLRLHEALLHLARDPQAVLQAMLDAHDSDAARAALQERFDIDEDQAAILMDAQFRRATRHDREKIEQSRAELLDHLRYLYDLRDQ
jgi:DNA gyrase/topoisomerase IV subunit A